MFQLITWQNIIIYFPQFNISAELINVHTTSIKKKVDQQAACA